ncbi:hypothetical protein VLK31_25565 [Variovorax sp. H27-G14]|uniref:hypothetical protein n=1 Tax=Variovorax sp. H27-G14 TaxID=3111914 RepID=UPI0038FC835B
MTFCAVLALPGLSLAVADTRFTFEGDSPGVVRHDGPDDLPLHITDTGYQTTLSFHRRKIRQIGRSWATGAGSVLALRAALDALSATALEDGTAARAHVLGQIDALLSEGRASGLADVQMLQSILMCARFAQAPEVPLPWAFTLGEQADDAPQAITSPILINWPLGLADSEHLAAAEDALDAGLTKSGGLPDIVRAFAGAVHASSQHCESCGPIAQIGFTADRGPKGVLSYYLSANAAQLSHCTDAEFDQLIGQPI